MKFPVLCWLILASVLVGCKTAPAPRPAPVAEANQVAPPPGRERPRTNALPILFIVGDSTVHNEAPGLVGWGDVIGRYFDPAKIVVENHARPGRSSRTFISQGWWAEIMAAARPGDFVMIQMGHNDSSPINDPKRARGSLPGSGRETTNLINGLTHLPETVHTYGDYLRQYISDTRAKGMTPILCTPVSRLPKPGRELDTTRYSRWMRQIAAEQNVPLVDLNRRVLERWQGQTPAQIKAAYFAGQDTTHFNRTGAELNAACVVSGLQALPQCSLSSFLLVQPAR